MAVAADGGGGDDGDVLRSLAPLGRAHRRSRRRKPSFSGDGRQLSRSPERLLCDTLSSSSARLATNWPPPPAASPPSSPRALQLFTHGLVVSSPPYFRLRHLLSLFLSPPLPPSPPVSVRSPAHIHTLPYTFSQGPLLYRLTSAHVIMLSAVVIYG